MPDIKELEGGLPPEEAEEERAGHGLFARVMRHRRVEQVGN